MLGSRQTPEPLPILRSRTFTVASKGLFFFRLLCVEIRYDRSHSAQVLSHAKGTSRECPAADASLVLSDIVPCFRKHESARSQLPPLRRMIACSSVTTDPSPPGCPYSIPVCVSGKQRRKRGCNQPCTHVEHSPLERTVRSCWLTLNRLRLLLPFRATIKGRKIDCPRLG